MTNLLQQALEHHQAGRLSEAETLYRQGLREQGDSFEGLYLLGRLLHQQRRHGECLPYLRQALTCATNDSARAQAGRMLTQALNNEGVRQWQSGQATAAVRLFQEAIALTPHDPELYYNEGLAHQQKGDGAAAVRCYEQALKLRADYPQAHHNVGVLLGQMGRFEAAEQHLRQALQLAPTAEGFYNLGNLYLAQRRLMEAIAPFQQAVSAPPEHLSAELRGQAWDNLGTAWQELGEAESARHAFQQSYQANPLPHVRLKAALTLPVIYDSLEQMTFWRARLIEEVGALKRAGVRLEPTAQSISPNFLLAYQGLNDVAIQQDIAELYGVTEQRLPQTDGTPSGKIKVGFISKYLKSHTIGQLYQGLIAQLPRDRFEVVLFALGRSAGDDVISQRIRQQADGYHQLPPDFTTAAAQIQQEHCAVLYYTDIGMDPLSYGLATRRLAPVQCATWGHPMTTGLPTIDYFISSALYEPPENQAHYREKLVRLEGLTIYYERPPQPAITKERSFFGLPEKAHLYLCPQSLFKFHPEFDGLLAEILRRDPQGQLILLEGAYSAWNQQLLRRFQRTMPEVIGRVQFVGRQLRADFLSLMGLADVILDTIHFCGGNSSLEAFAMHTPVVTMPSEFLRGRLTSGFYQQMGLSQYISPTPAAYIEQAVRLGTEPSYRAQVQADIATHHPTLFADNASVEAVATFLEEAIHHAEKG